MKLTYSYFLITQGMGKTVEEPQYIILFKKKSREIIISPNFFLKSLFLEEKAT